MALKDTWKDKQNGQDIVDADDINSIAHAVIEMEEDSGNEDAFVLYTEQTLTEEQKEQARTNIGAVSESVIDELKKPVVKELDYETAESAVIQASTGKTLNAGDTAICLAKVIVTPLKEYTVSGSCRYGFAYWAFYDEQDATIQIGETAKVPYATFENVTLTAPENAKYLRVAYVTSNVIAKIQTVSMELALDTYATRWEGKKWVCVGDSLTAENDRTTKHYFDYVAEKTGISVINMGHSGTGYKRSEENNYAFYQRIVNVPDNFDAITIFGSFNDLGVTNYTLGEITDTGTDTICGCINTTISTLFENHPTAQLGIVTPTPWGSANRWNYYSDGTTPIDKDEKYVQALIDIAQRWGIPCLDLYSCSGLRPWDADFLPVAYSKDGGGSTHPDETGHAIIAPRFKAFLESLIL